MLGVQAHLNKSGMHGGIRRVDSGEAIVDADVVDDDAEVFGPDDFLDQALKIRDFSLGDGELGARGRLKRDDELTRVSLWEVRKPELTVQQETRYKGGEEQHQHGYRYAQDPMDQDFVPSEHPIEGSIERCVEALSPADFVF